jgi:hypothetical protein
MTAPENFLSRWSRKKLDAAEEPAPPAADTASAPPSPDDAADKPAGEAADLLAPATNAAKPAAPAFDPASLPSLDSIGAQTDIRGFLQPGVPAELARAALRRAWSSDPAIRDFKGLAENDWDFTDPNAMFGFGELGPDVDIKRMLAAVFGETPMEEIASSPAKPDAVNPESAALASETTTADEIAAPDRSDESPVADEETNSAREGGDAPAQDLAAADIDLVQRNNNIASQDENLDSKPEPDRHYRSHGSALPR